MLNEDKPFEILVNREHLLDESYVPSLYTLVDRFPDLILKASLREDIMPYYLKMLDGANRDGVDFTVHSGYRSYQHQKRIMEERIKKQGVDALKYVAPAGASEHQTGLAFDVLCIVDGEYKLVSSDDDDAIIWLKENGYKYGFILRYPKGKENITGFNYERWHYRFVGPELADYLYQSQLTLEEYHMNKTLVKRR